MAETVATQTQRRGRKAAGGRLGRFLAVAVALHLPLTPLGPLIGLIAWLRPAGREAPEERLNAIPISLLSADELAQMGLTEPQAPPAVPPAAAPEPGGVPAVPEAPAPPPRPKPKPRPKPLPSAEPDAGAADAAPSVVPADAGDGGARPAPIASASPPDGGARPRPGGDPLALAGAAATVADPNANVRFLLFNDRIRPLPIAPRIGRLVARLPQWRSFFGPTSLDPIRDVDRMYLAGPQLRVSSDVVAVVRYSVPQASMRQAIDAIVRREPKGEWLNTKVPAARARADRADRVFVLPRPGILMMVPPYLKDDAIEKAPALDVPAVGGGAAFIAFVAQPWRALGARGPVEVPKSIRKVTFTLIPASDGGATLRIDALDESPDAARSHAALLTSAVNTLTQQNMGAVGALLFGSATVSFIEPVNLVAKGASIQGDAHVTSRQLDRLIGFAEGWVDSLEAPPRPASSGAPLSSGRPSPVPR